MDFNDFTDVQFMADLASGRHWDNEEKLEPKLQDLSMDPLSDAPTPVAPQDSAPADPEVAAGGQVAPAAEAPQITEPAAAPPAASAPAPSGADALFNSPKSGDSRADSVLGDN